jgi:endonuclease/exonuclease/phosphatase (EEP) superfamily protein YafD
MDAKGASRIIGLLALAATGIVALPLICGFFARLHPVFDTLAHFRVHLAIFLLIAAIPLLFLRGFRWNGVMASALGAGAILSVVGISTLVGPGASQAALQPDDETAAVYKLLHLNLRYDNPEHGKVLSLIGRLMPDVVTLNEVSPPWAEKIALLAGSYRYRIVCHIDNHAGGVAILSLRPFAEGDGQCLEGGTFATAKLDFGGYPVEVGAMHLHWPWPFDQAKQIEDLAPLLGAMGDAAILAGDLNATPWSAASARVAEAGGMTPVGPWQPTWLYRKLPEFIRFAGLPIDRIFAKGDVDILSVETLEAVGSDHLPVLVEFSVAPEDGGPRPQSATASLNGASSTGAPIP